jgi:hypothetical protein
MHKSEPRGVRHVTLRPDKRTQDIARLIDNRTKGGRGEMRIHFFFAMIFLFGCVGVSMASCAGDSDCKGSFVCDQGECVRASAKLLPSIRSDKKAVLRLSRSFATSKYLGTGAQQYVNRIKIMSSTEAYAVIGEIGSEGNDPDAYSARLVKSLGRWSILSVAYILSQSGEKKVDVLSPPYSK